MKKISISEQDQADLKAMLDWWKRHRLDPLADFKTKPIFQGKRKNTGICINDEILRRSLEKAKTDKTRTGGSISSLIETLLWKYLECPSDVVETSDANGFEEA